MEYVERNEKMRFFADGNLTFLGGVSVAVLGATVVVTSVAYAPTKWIFIGGVFLGVSLVAIASACLKSLVLGLKPFTNDPLGWRKAKQSYKEEEGLNAPAKRDDLQ